MTRLREESIAKCKEQKITNQPYIIVVGSTLKDIEDTYVCVDDVLYTVSSTVEAIDICFKIFHVFQLKYPTASEHLWLLIQKYIYKFSTKWDSVFPSIEYIMKKIESTTELYSSSS